MPFLQQFRALPDFCIFAGSSNKCSASIKNYITEAKHHARNGSHFPLRMSSYARQLTAVFYHMLLLGQSGPKPNKTVHSSMPVLPPTHYKWGATLIRAAWFVLLKTLWILKLSTSNFLSTIPKSLLDSSSKSWRFLSKGPLPHSLTTLFSLRGANLTGSTSSKCPYYQK